MYFLTRSDVSRRIGFGLSVVIFGVLLGCGKPGDHGQVNFKETNSPPPSDSTVTILLFNGKGTSPNDVRALEKILKANHAKYATVNSAQLDLMTDAQIREHRLLIVPGGNFIEMGNHLTTNATAKVRHAVESGLNYFGICAGAFLAGNSPSNGLTLTSGIRFGFYSAENSGSQKAAVPIERAGAPTLDQYWEDGPQLSGWGQVIGKYPDGTAALAQGSCGQGFVILSGVHPEAPADWRGRMKFTTPASADNAYAWTLIEAALNRVALPHY